MDRAGGGGLRVRLPASRWKLTSETRRRHSQVSSVGPRPAGPGAGTRTTGPGGARGTATLGGRRHYGGSCKALQVEGVGCTKEAEVEGRAEDKADLSELVVEVSLCFLTRL